MSNFQIHELTSGTIDRDSNVIHDTLNGGNYETRKATAGAVADLANENVASAYNSATTYAIGQYCLHEGNIYRCIAITTGAFDSTAWVQIVVTGEFRRVVELTSAQYTALSSAEKNNGTLYIITDEETTAADIPYSAGVSVADKLATIPTSETGTITPSAITTIIHSSIKKYGGLVCFSMDFKVSSNASWSKICDVPSAYKPPINSYFVAINSGTTTGTQLASLQLSSGGSLNIANLKPDTNVQYSLCATWLV